jgi:hypothetical protein
MKNQILIAILSCLILASSAEARDDELHMPVDNVMNNPEYAARLAGMTYYFGDQPHPAVAHRFVRVAE